MIIIIFFPQGIIEYMEAKIQLLDLPGIIEGAAEGKGRGRQV
jgi:ribosome-interacting GTPase 1